MENFVHPVDELWRVKSQHSGAIHLVLSTMPIALLSNQRGASATRYKLQQRPINAKDNNINYVKCLIVTSAVRQLICNDSNAKVFWRALVRTSVAATPALLQYFLYPSSIDIILYLERWYRAFEYLERVCVRRRRVFPLFRREAEFPTVHNAVLTRELLRGFKADDKEPPTGDGEQTRSCGVRERCRSEEIEFA